MPSHHFAAHPPSCPPLTPRLHPTPITIPVASAPTSIPAALLPYIPVVCTASPAIHATRTWTQPFASFVWFRRDHQADSKQCCYLPWCRKEPPFQGLPRVNSELSEPGRKQTEQSFPTSSSYHSGCLQLAGKQREENKDWLWGKAGAAEAAGGRETSGVMSWGAQEWEQDRGCGRLAGIIGEWMLHSQMEWPHWGEGG